VGRFPFAAALLGVAGTLLWLSARLPPGDPMRSLVSLARGAGLVLALGFSALAPGLQSFEPEGRLASSVPGAALVQYGVWRPSALYYFADVERFTFIPRPPRAGPGPGPRTDPGFEAAIARLRADGPVFCMTKERYAAALMHASGARLVSQRPKVVLLGNRAAHDGVARSRERGPG
jgi:hypothetical protein